MRGLVAVLLSGITGGAFPLPEKHITGWQWEHVWAVYSLVAMLILPIGTAVLFAPSLLGGVVGNRPTVWFEVVAAGLLFGAGSVLFGVSLVRLGMAITNALVSGTIVLLGSIGPVLIGSVHLAAKQMMLLLAGLLLLVASLALCAGAAIRRDKAREITEAKAAGGSVGSVVIALLAGIFSAMLNIGFAVGEPLAANAAARGFGPMMATLAIWIPALLGGMLLNVGYPLFRIGQKKSWRLFVSGAHPWRPVLLAASMGVLWYANIMLYGYGASSMTAGAVYGWAISSAVSILTSNAFGAMTGEWRGAGAQAKAMMAGSTVLLIGSFVVLAGQSLSI